SVRAGRGRAGRSDGRAGAPVWGMGEPFLRRCDEVDVGRFIVHGHTPQMDGRPDLRRRRVNVDTGAVIGGPLTAAMFDASRAEPLGFVTDREGGWFAALSGRGKAG